MEKIFRSVATLKGRVIPEGGDALNTSGFSGDILTPVWIGSFFGGNFNCSFFVFI